MTTSKIATAFKTATFALAAGAVALGLASPADAAAGTMYGDPAAAAKYWRQQTYDDCVLMSAADVIGQVTGREPSERAIIKVAQSTPSVVHPGSIYTKPADAEHPNSGMGTSVADIPTLLAHYGVDAVITDEDHATATGVATGMAALEQYLGSGHAVIVSINAEMIWGQPVEETDSAGNPRSDHAVVVTGVDTENGIVHLNDSGTPTGRDEQIPMETFVEAWATSHDFMAVTTRTALECRSPQRAATRCKNTGSAARRSHVWMSTNRIPVGHSRSSLQGQHFTRMETADAAVKGHRPGTSHGVPRSWVLTASAKRGITMTGSDTLLAPWHRKPRRTRNGW